MMAAVTDNHKERIRQWGRVLDGDIALRYATTGHAVDERFRAFVDLVADLAPRVRAKKDGDAIVSRPRVILDDRFRWTGSVDAGELVTLMLNRDSADLGPDALRGMIEDGNAEGVARMMAERGVIFPAFIELLSHPRWSVRLGAMVSFETLAESDVGLAGGVVEPLVAIFADVDDGIKGDLIHVMGESGNKAALLFLATVAAGNYDEEVRSAAGEAIEKLS